MGAVYATVNDITAYGYTLTTQQQNAVANLLEMASAKLRTKAKSYGKDIDSMIEADEDYIYSVKSAVISSVMRALTSISDTNSPAITQGSETNGNYSISMTYLNAGQSLYYLRNELKDLGLLRQTIGFIDVYGSDEE